MTDKRPKATKTIKASHVEDSTAARAEIVPLKPVEINGWQLFTSAADHWMLDLYLAERAGLKNPRDITATIRHVIADGGVKVIGTAAAEVCGALGVGSVHYAVKSTGKNSARSKGTAETPAPGSVGTADATIRAEYEVISKGDRGGSQRVTRFYLDRTASLLTIMKLRTPKAVQLQGAVCDVFFAAMDGKLAGRPSQDQSAVLASLEVLRSNLATLTQALVADRIQLVSGAPVRDRIAEVATKTGLSHGDVDQAVRGLISFGGTGASWDLLTPEASSRALMACAVIERVVTALAPRPKKRRPGVRVTLHLEGTGKHAEQLVLNLVEALKKAA